MYADSITRSMNAAILETNRRRKIQLAYNEENGIVPRTVIKGVRDVIEIGSKEERKSSGKGKKEPTRKLSASERERMIELLTKEMKAAASKLEFEQAAFLRDRIRRLREGKNDI
jgi:excinuclease ABC subunit B